MLDQCAEISFRSGGFDRKTEPSGRVLTLLSAFRLSLSTLAFLVLVRLGKRALDLDSNSAILAGALVELREMR